MARVCVHLNGKPKDKDLRSAIESLTVRVRGRGISVHQHNCRDQIAFEAILKGLNGDLILLDEAGEQFDSIEFASMIKDVALSESDLHLAIASADGFTDEYKQGGRLLSLSRATMPHELAALVLVEQIYRATEINRGSPYHRS